METVIQGSTLQTLRAGLRGTAHAPGEEGYEEASRAWNLAAHQSPALVVVAGGAADVMAAVRFAREGGSDARGARRADHGHFRDDALRGDGLHKHGPGRPDGRPPALRDAERVKAA